MGMYTTKEKALEAAKNASYNYSFEIKFNERLGLYYIVWNYGEPVGCCE